MDFQGDNEYLTQKEIQKVLEVWNFWPAKGLKLECLKPKLFNCQLVAECEICVKKHKYDSCKFLKQYSGSITSSKNWKYEVFALSEKRCQCVTKIYCANCKGRKEKYVDCEDLLPKYINDSNYLIL